MGAYDRTDMAVELRPGVFRPDWSVVSTDTVREALGAKGAARASLVERWITPLSGDEDKAFSTSSWSKDVRLASRRWRASPSRNGRRLTIEEGLEMGRAVFGPLLAEPAKQAARRAVIADQKKLLEPVAATGRKAPLMSTEERNS